MVATFNAYNGFHFINDEGNYLGFDFFGILTLYTGYRFNRIDGAWISESGDLSDYKITAIVGSEQATVRDGEVEYEIDVIGLRYERIVNGVATQVGVLNTPSIHLVGSSTITIGEAVEKKVAEVGLSFTGSAQIDIFAPNNLYGFFNTTATYDVGEGNDSVFTSNDGIDTVFGRGGDDRIETSGGNDVIDGGGGADTIDAGTGNDIVRAGDGDDRFDAGQGYLYESVRLGEGNDFFEGGRGSDFAWGDAGDDVMWGNTEAANGLLLAESGDGDDSLDGRDGNDTLYGNQGDDTLFGDSGRDKLYGGRQSDVIYGGDDDDLLYGDSSVGDEREAGNDRLWGESGNDHIYGGGGSDQLDGNDGNDALDGGSGADSMAGGGGNDTFVVDDKRDLVLEEEGGGVDKVFASTSYTLAAGQEIEGLQLLASTGSANLNLTGNEISQSLVGNNGNNVLDGGVGRDAMTGRGGNDTYIVDNLGDRVTEAAGGGKDTVLCKVSYALAAGQEIEALQLLTSTGSSRFNLSGNEFGQSLVGNTGANVLDGKGGADVLTGRGGPDTFVFSTALGSGNVDRIADFAAEDTIRLAKGIFTAIAPGPLAQNAFKNISQSALDADDRILYKQTTGQLLYDADGSGKGNAILFAVLDNKAALTHADIVIA